MIYFMNSEICVSQFVAPSTCSTAACTELTKTFATPKSYKTLKTTWRWLRGDSNWRLTSLSIAAVQGSQSAAPAMSSAGLWKAETSTDTKHIVCTLTALWLVLCCWCFASPAFAEESAERLGAVAAAGGVFVPLDTGRAPAYPDSKNLPPWCLPRVI